jgi:hypothetical protein
MRSPANDPRVKLSIYEADPTGSVHEKAIRKANPAFGDFQNAKEVLAMAEDARRMPSREPEFRNLILNQRVEMNSPFISKSVWQSCGGKFQMIGAERRVRRPRSVGDGRSHGPFVPIAWVDDAWEVKPTFWLPGEGLREKSRTDRVPYDVWHADGHLLTTPGRAVEYEFVAR